MRHQRERHQQLAWGGGREGRYAGAVAADAGGQGRGQDPLLLRPPGKAKMPAGEGRRHARAHTRIPDLQPALPQRRGPLKTVSQG